MSIRDPDPADETSEADGFDGPSRSQLRREALDVFKLAEALAALSEAELARVPIDEDIVAEVKRARAVSSHIARKRQLQFLAKQMRKLDEDALDAIRRTLAQDRAIAYREAAHLHEVERWRDRLIDEGDDALAEFLVAHPGADRQRLRQLARNASGERASGKPPHAYRELFRALRDVMLGAGNRESGMD